MLDLDAIEARVEAADPAPWYLSDLDTAWEDHKPVIARLDSSVITRHEPSHPPTLSSPNVQFVLHARTDIPALVAELRAAREAKERVLDMHSSNSGGWCWECAHPSPCRTVTALDAYRAVVGEA
jgi:hypothetical protein